MCSSPDPKSRENAAVFTYDGLLSAEAEARSNWPVSDAAVGQSGEQRRTLEACLGLHFDDAIETKTENVAYNYATRWDQVWRQCHAVVRFRSQLDPANYPFDVSRLAVQVHGPHDFDPAEVVLVPWQDRKSCPNGPSRLEEVVEQGPAASTVGATPPVPPRGFDLTLPISLSGAIHRPSADITPSCVVWLDIDLVRRHHSALWRTFIPALVILLFGFVATVAALASPDMGVAVSTGVLPSVLIACVALQLTAAQGIPPSSPRTRMDEIFVYVYLFLLCMFEAFVKRSAAPKTSDLEHVSPRFC